MLVQIVLGMPSNLPCQTHVHVVPSNGLEIMKLDAHKMVVLNIWLSYSLNLGDSPLQTYVVHKSIGGFTNNVTE